MNIEAKQVWRSVTGELRQVIGVAVNGEWLIETIKTGNLLRIGENQYNIVFDKLITNADGSPAEPPEPEPPHDQFTTVRLAPHGTITMFRPGNESHNDDHRNWTVAVQNCGIDGYTCVGFQFAEVPDEIWPTPLGWYAGNSKQYAISIMRRFDTDKLIIATTAVWRRLGA